MNVQNSNYDIDYFAFMPFTFSLGPFSVVPSITRKLNYYIFTNMVNSST